MIRLRFPASKNQWAALLLGIGITAGCVIPLVQGVNSLAWTKTDAVITYIGEKPGSRIIGIDVKYRYAAAGRTFTGDRYRFQFFLTANRMRSRDVQLAIGRYPIGERVQVAVDPVDPSESVLLPGPDLESLIPLGLGLFLMLAGAGEVRKQEKVQPELYLGPPRPRYRTAKILAAIGLVLLLIGARYLYQGLASQNWPTAEGRILYSHARTGRSYETLLWYEYYVGNQRYLAGNYRAGGNSTPFRDVAVAAAKRYPEGRAVKVHYNPSSPGEALLEPGVWYGNFVLPGIALIVLVAAWLAKKYAEAVATRRPR
jgi:hypothetical protein